MKGLAIRDQIYTEQPSLEDEARPLFEAWYVEIMGIGIGNGESYDFNYYINNIILTNI